MSRVFKSRHRPEVLSICFSSKMLFTELLAPPQLTRSGSCLSTHSHHFSNPTDPICIAALEDRPASTCICAKTALNLIANTMGLAHHVSVLRFKSSFQFLFASISDVSCLHDAWGRPTILVVLVECVGCLIWTCPRSMLVVLRSHVASVCVTSGWPSRSFEEGPSTARSMKFV